MHSSTSFVIAALAAMAHGHMNMASPPPLKYKGNPNAKTIDYDITSPNTAATFPCKGALDVLGTDEAASVATWAPGSQQTVTIEGGASHDGGSCQLSLSYDKGTTWTVIYSKEGNCPTEPTLDFTVPSDTPAGDDVLLGWTWVNKTGNREFYMTCASITISGSSTKREEIEHPNKPAKRATAFADRPAMFVAQLGTNNFCVAEGVDVLYPEPGPDVDNVATNGASAIYCDSQQAVTAGDSGSGSGSSASATAPAATSGYATGTTSTSAAATTTTSAVATTTTAATSSVSMYVPTYSPSSLISSVTVAPFTNSSTASATMVTSPTDLTIIPISKTESSSATLSETGKLTSSSSSPGGVFITTSAAASSAAQTTQQTTLSTKTTKVGSGSSSAAATKSSSAAPSTGTVGPVSGGQTGPCTDEGAWACLDGSSFQRCASGAWSAVMPMAAGTTCTVGISDTLNMQRRNARRVRRSFGDLGHA